MSATFKKIVIRTIQNQGKYSLEEQEIVVNLYLGKMLTLEEVKEIEDYCINNGYPIEKSNED